MQVSVRHKGTVIVTFVGYENGHLITLLPYDTCNNALHDSFQNKNTHRVGESLFLFVEDCDWGPN